MSRESEGQTRLSRRLFGRDPAPAKGDGFTTLEGLKEAGFPLHRETYPPGGCLFRGIAGELLAGAVRGAFGQNREAGAPARLERELGVLLCSSNPADAVGAAGLWEPDRKAGVAVFPAEAFAAEQEAGRAGILAHAEGGMVFRYPFLTTPLPLDWITRILAPSALLEALEERLGVGRDSSAAQERLQAFRRRLMPLELPPVAKRRAAERAVREVLATLGETPAIPVRVPV